MERDPEEIAPAGTPLCLALLNYLYEANQPHSYLPATHVPGLLLDEGAIRVGIARDLLACDEDEHGDPIALWLTKKGLGLAEVHLWQSRSRTSLSAAEDHVLDRMSRFLEMLIAELRKVSSTEKEKADRRQWKPLIGQIKAAQTCAAGIHVHLEPSYPDKAIQVEARLTAFLGELQETVNDRLSPPVVPRPSMRSSIQNEGLLLGILIRCAMRLPRRPSDGESVAALPPAPVDPPSLLPVERAVLNILLAAPPGKGIVGPDILTALDQRGFDQTSQSYLTTDIIPKLRDFGVPIGNLGGGRGYQIDRTKLPGWVEKLPPAETRQ